MSRSDTVIIFQILRECFQLKDKNYGSPERTSSPPHIIFKKRQQYIVASSYNF